MEKLNKFAKENQNCRSVIKMFQESCWSKTLLNCCVHKNKNHPSFAEVSQLAWETRSAEFNCSQVFYLCMVELFCVSVSRLGVATVSRFGIVPLHSHFSLLWLCKKVTLRFDTELLHSYLLWESFPQALQLLARSLTIFTRHRATVSTLLKFWVPSFKYHWRVALKN